MRKSTTFHMSHDGPSPSRDTRTPCGQVPGVGIFTRPRSRHQSSRGRERPRKDWKFVVASDPPAGRRRISKRGCRWGKQSNYWVHSGTSYQTGKNMLIRTILRTTPSLPATWKRGSGGKNVIVGVTPERFRWSVEGVSQCGVCLETNLSA